MHSYIAAFKLRLLECVNIISNRLMTFQKTAYKYEIFVLIFFFCLINKYFNYKLFWYFTSFSKYTEI